MSALLVDGLALWAIAARISEFGFSPNKVAALGENLILLVNLGWSAVLYGRFLAGRAAFTTDGAMADGVPARLRAVGVGGGRGLPAGVRVPVAGRPHRTGTTRARTDLKAGVPEAASSRRGTSTFASG